MPKKYVKHDPSHYVNMRTGEILPPNSKVEVLEEVEDELNTFRINYKSYFTISEEAISYLEENFSDSEFVRIIKMCKMTRAKARIDSNLNFLYKTNKTLHTKNTLQKSFGIKRTVFNNFFRKLVSNNIIFYGKTGYKGRTIKAILLNPYLSKKHLHTNEELKVIFKPLKGSEIPTP